MWNFSLFLMKYCRGESECNPVCVAQILRYPRLTAQYNRNCIYMYFLFTLFTFLQCIGFSFMCRKQDSQWMPAKYMEKTELLMEFPEKKHSSIHWLVTENLVTEKTCHSVGVPSTSAISGCQLALLYGLFAPEISTEHLLSTHFVFLFRMHFVFVGIKYDEKTIFRIKLYGLTVQPQYGVQFIKNFLFGCLSAIIIGIVYTNLIYQYHTHKYMETKAESIRNCCSLNVRVSMYLLERWQYYMSGTQCKRLVTVSQIGVTICCYNVHIHERRTTIKADSGCGGI